MHFMLLCILLLSAYIICNHGYLSKIYPKINYFVHYNPRSIYKLNTSKSVDNIHTLRQVTLSTTIHKTIYEDTVTQCHSTYKRALKNTKWEWNDMNNYIEIINHVISLLKGNDKDSQPYYIIYHADKNYGFSNQFRALSGLFLAALVTGRQFRIHWDTYFQCTDSYFTELKYNKTKLNRLHPRRSIGINKKFFNALAASSYDLDSIFGKRHVDITTITDISTHILHNSIYRKKLQQLGFQLSSIQESSPDSYTITTDRSIRGQIARLLLNPTGDVFAAIQPYILQIKQKTSISIQVRTGGSIANQYEANSFLNYESIPYIYQEYNYALNYLNKTESEIVLYLSTDSYAMRHKLINIWNTSKIVFSSDFQLGHSSLHKARGKSVHNQVKRAILDLIMISQCDYILYTRNSSFGQLGMRLALNKPTRSLCQDKLCEPFA